MNTNGTYTAFYTVFYLNVFWSTGQVGKMEFDEIGQRVPYTYKKDVLFDAHISSEFIRIILLFFLQFLYSYTHTYLQFTEVPFQISATAGTTS